MRVNNRVRRAIEAAVGSLTLLSPDPAKRLEAAKAVFKSKDVSVLATLDAAIGKESDARVKKALDEARAAIIVGKPDAKEATGWPQSSSARSRQPGRAQRAGGRHRRPAGNIQKALADALTTIDNRLAVWNVAQNLWYGLSLGSVLLLAAIGLAITFGVMGVINMAHGEMVMLGAYTTFVVQEMIRPRRLVCSTTRSRSPFHLLS